MRLEKKSKKKNHTRFMLTFQNANYVVNNFRILYCDEKNNFEIKIIFTMQIIHMFKQCTIILIVEH